VSPHVQRRVGLALVDECQPQRPDLLVNHAPRVDVGHRDVERVAEMREPLAGERACDRQEVVAVLERQMRGAAVVVYTAEPLAEESLLCCPLACQIPAKEGPQRNVVVDAVVEPIDEHPDRGMPTDARKEIAADERTMSISVSQEPTVFHLLPKEDGGGSFKQTQRRLL
jgi:hypothetical protein